MSQLAFLGLGRMGMPMAKRLLASGHAVQVWNRSPAACQSLLNQCDKEESNRLQVCTSAHEAVQKASFVFTMLSDGPAVTEVLFGSEVSAHFTAVASAMMPGACVVDMSSIPPATARMHFERFQAMGCSAVDAPVSGGVVGAEQGTLAIMAGGEASRVAELTPILSALGRVTYVGPAGSGQLAKLANQIIVGVTIGAVAEALMLVAQGGADPAAVRAAIRGGFAESRILELHGERMLKQNFVPGGAIQTQLKDLTTALAEARESGLQLPVTGLLQQLFADAKAHGDGGLDHSALLRELARLNAIEPEKILSGSS
jgi:2-hydroxy-3-oxopropionate reductase